MKKYILTILITAIVCITGTVIASNYLASEVVYNDTTVENALNELYTTTNELKEYNENNKIVKGKAYLVNGVYTLDLGFVPNQVFVKLQGLNDPCVYTYNSGATWYISVPQDKWAGVYSNASLTGTVFTLTEASWNYEYLEVYAIK